MYALDELGLLASPAPPRLVHPSLSTAVYAALGREPRERLHLAAARALHTAGLPAELVAEHLLLGGHSLSRWGVNVLRSAAARAAEYGAADRAAKLLQAAMLTGPVDRRLRAQLTIDLAAAERDTDPLSCVQRVRNAVPQLDPGPARAAAVLLVPPILAAGNPPIADLLRRAAEELAASDQAVLHPGLALRLEARTRLLNLHGPTRSGPDRPDPPPLADPLPEQGPEDGTEPKRGRLEARVNELLRSGHADTGAGRELLAVLAWEAVLTGGLSATGVAALCARVVQGEPADPAHVHTALSVLVGAAMAADAADLVEPWIERTAAAAPERASAGVRACLAAEQAVVLAGTGRLERARKLGVRLLESADSAWPASRALAASALATVALQSQDVSLAELLLDGPWPLADRWTQLTCRMLRGMVAACSHELTEALEEFLDVGRELSRAGWTDTGRVPWRTWAATVYERLGEHDRAVALAEAELQAAREWGGPTQIGCALRLLGMLTPDAERLRFLREAVSVHRRSANRLELGRSALVLGRALRTERLPGSAQLLATAEQLARSCDASWPEANGGELLGPVPRLLRSGRDKLSPAEDAVVDLAQRGLSNAQIAEELSVTRRAVEKHLTNVYRKLGVSGRASLLAELSGTAPNLDPGPRPHPPNSFP
jgi:DNA-binding CsgD family transcriptional regulator